MVGFKLTGTLKEGTTATDLVLTVTQMLRAHGVVGKFVEFYGPGGGTLALPDRATIGNMAPEYGATCGMFTIDKQTIDYLQLTNRSESVVDLVTIYSKRQHLFRSNATVEAIYASEIELDLTPIVPSIAGPKRPQDRVDLSAMKSHWHDSLTAPIGHSGHGVDATQSQQRVEVIGSDGRPYNLKHGDIVISAITSCTNTSNPSVMLGAGILARNAVKKGRKVAPCHYSPF